MCSSIVNKNRGLQSTISKNLNLTHVQQLRRTFSRGASPSQGLLRAPVLNPVLGTRGRADPSILSYAADVAGLADPRHESVHLANCRKSATSAIQSERGAPAESPDAPLTYFVGAGRGTPPANTPRLLTDQLTSLDRFDRPKSPPGLRSLLPPDRPA